MKEKEGVKIQLDMSSLQEHMGNKKNTKMPKIQESLTQVSNLTQPQNIKIFISPNFIFFKNILLLIICLVFTIDRPPNIIHFVNIIIVIVIKCYTVIKFALIHEN